MNNHVKDLKGQRFGRLLVVSYDKSIKGNASWNCQCDCGNKVTVLAIALKNGSTKSCGCLSKETGAKMAKANLRNKKTQQKAQQNKLKNDSFEGTLISSLQRKSAKKNKSGVKGVIWIESRSKWQASITIRGKQKFLGRFIKLEDAVEARKKAEKEYFEPILKKIDKQLDK